MDAVVLNCLTKCNVVWCVGTFLFLPMSKCRRKTRRVRVAELKKNVSTANARCSSDQRCMMTEGFKPLYPAMCVSSRHLQRCRQGAKFKSSNFFYPTLYLFIPILYMFRATKCSSSSESNVAIRPLVFLTLQGCPKSKCTDLLFKCLLGSPEVISNFLQSMTLGKLHNGSNVFPLVIAVPEVIFRKCV